MKYETIKLDRDARGVARLTLVRGDKHNALNQAMIRELTDAATALRDDATIRAVVLAGEGQSFCAGADLGWMREQAGQTVERRLADAAELAGMLAALDSLPMPLIARVHGPAYGGGVGLVAIADIAIAATEARFALTEVRLGLVPATIGPYVVARLGEPVARRIMMSARPLTASEALAAGLVSAVVAPADLDAALGAEIATFLACAPGAVAATKRLCRHLARNPGADHAAFTAGLLAERWQTAEAAEGLAAFFDKRAPSWRRDVL